MLLSAVMASALMLTREPPKTPALVPKPVSIVTGAGSFALDDKTSIGTDAESRPAARLLAGWLKDATGHEPKVGRRGKISLKVDPALASLGDEGYRLEVNPSEIRLRAPKYAGIACGVQTLRQLLPTSPKQPVAIPAVVIEDRPAYAWRGMMLDVARYFLDKKYVLHYLDILAAHKFNVLHLHLIDDQGWRVEIKKYPKLTEIGGFRGEGAKREGGFYTQADIREIVAYAKIRNITVVPEIELPAHTLSAVCAYPWLSCTGAQHKMPTTHFISDDLYCAGKPSTWAFLKDVLGELCDLFPSTTVHVGGDEARYDKWKACPNCQRKIKELGLKDEKALQGWMTREIEAMLQKKGRRILGWDEILRCGVSETAGIMPWHDPQAGADAARRGNPIVPALIGHCYFDTPDANLPGELPGASWLPPVSLQMAYDWNPTPDGLTPDQAKNVLGPHGCLWTDMFLHRPELKTSPGPALYVDYFTLPRAAALAEVGWTPLAQRNFPDFQRRMRTQYVRYEALGWNYRLPLPEVTVENGQLSALSPIDGGTVRYTLDGSAPTLNSPALTGPISAKLDDLRALSVSPGGKRASLIWEKAPK